MVGLKNSDDVTQRSSSALDEWDSRSGEFEIERDSLLNKFAAAAAARRAMPSRNRILRFFILADTGIR